MAKGRRGWHMQVTPALEPLCQRLFPTFSLISYGSNGNDVLHVIGFRRNKAIKKTPFVNVMEHFTKEVKNTKIETV